MAIKDGGPAFPEFGRERTYVNEADRFGRYEYVAVGGMSLRDWFAGQTLIGLMANEARRQEARECVDENAAPPGVIPIDYEVALSAYEMADAMLKAREATAHV